MDSKQFRKAVAKAGYVAEDPVADARLAQVCATLPFTLTPVQAALDQAISALS